MAKTSSLCKSPERSKWAMADSRSRVRAGLVKGKWAVSVKAEKHTLISKKKGVDVSNAVAL